MKIKPQFIGKDLNLPNLADQAIAHMKTLGCWYQYASGQRAIGRKASMNAITKHLETAGLDADTISQFRTDLVVRLRTEQRAEEAIQYSDE